MKVFERLGNDNARVKSYPGVFPGGLVAKILPSSAGGVGSIPGRGAKIPHASGQKTKT